MSDHVPAIFDAGVFRQLEPVDWPDGTRAEVILVDSQLNISARQWPTGYFEQTAGAFQGEEFERPAQGELPQRKIGDGISIAFVSDHRQV